MSDGGDWNTEEEEDEPTSVPNKVTLEPVARRLNPIGALSIAAVLFGFGVGFFIVGKSDPSAEKHFAPVGDLPEAASAPPKVDERQVLGETNDILAAKLIEASSGDFQQAKRDSLAVELLKLQSESEGRLVGAEEILARAGAWEILLEAAPAGSKTWYDIAMRTADSERILSTDTILANEEMGARALCFAGATADVMEIYQSKFQSALESADGIACGLNSTTSPLPFRGLTLRDEAVGVAASRGAVDPVDLFLTFRRKHSATNSPLLMDIGAALYVAGKIRDQDILDVATSVQQECDGLPRGAAGLSESVSPDILLAAAKKLEASALPKTHKATAVENLYIAAALAGFLRLEDTRNSVVATTPRNERCLAQVEYQFEPEAALTRLKRLEATEAPGGELQSLLALTEARLGHFEEAFGHTKNGLDLIRLNTPSHTSMNWMLIAFAHRTGQLDRIKLVNPNEAMFNLLDALQGNPAAMKAYRVSEKSWVPQQTVTAVEFYLRGALAPGHEDAFMDGLIDQTSTVSHYQFSRAEAAAWLGDDESAKKWSTQREGLHQRASGGKFGGHYLLWTR
jgi:hypothetical protein